MGSDCSILHIRKGTLLGGLLTTRGYETLGGDVNTDKGLFIFKALPNKRQPGDTPRTTSKQASCLYQTSIDELCPFYVTKETLSCSKPHIGKPF